MEDMTEQPSCHLKQEIEADDTCPTYSAFETQPADARLEAYPSTSAAGSENHAPVPMNETILLVKEESIESNESWLEGIKEEPPSPLSMNTQREDLDDVDDLDIDLKKKELCKEEVYDSSEEITMTCSTERQKQVPMTQAYFLVKAESVDSNELWTDQIKQEPTSPLATPNEEPDDVDDHDIDMKEFFKEDSQYTQNDCSAWNCSSQTAASFVQSPSGETTELNCQKHFTENPSVHGTVVVPSAQSQKPFAFASCSTADDEMSEDEGFDTYLLKRRVIEQVSRSRQEQHSYQSEVTSSATHGTLFHKANLQSGSLGGSTGERHFKCSHCGKTFKTKHNLTTHMRIHTGERLYKCSQCGKSFIYRSDLTKHMHSHTGKRLYKCSVCAKSFKHSGSLTRHMRKHTGERPSKCSQCGKSFTESSRLTEHMRKHSGERPFKCSLCEKSFSRSGHLTVHMRKHTGERPFKCSLCKKSFSQSCTLTTHMRKHTGERPYKCSQCGKSFTKKGGLIRHMHSHTGERPYKCSQCGKSFTQSGVLTRHMRKHTGKQP